MSTNLNKQTVVNQEQSTTLNQKTIERITIQAVYCSTSEQCLQACWQLYKDHKWGPNNIIEVPFDDTIYHSVVTGFQKWLDKKMITIPNVSDATQIIRRGKYTIAQATRIVESNKFSMIKKIMVGKTETIICTLPIGLSPIVTTAMHLIQGKPFVEAIQYGLYSMIALGGEKMIAYLMEKSKNHPVLHEPMCQVLMKGGYKGETFSVNSSVEDLLNMKSGKSLLAEGIFRVATLPLPYDMFFGVTTAIDLIQYSKDKKSDVQVAKNTIDNAIGATGGVTGVAVGAVVGTVLLPGVGTVLGGLFGGLIGGAATTKVTSVITGEFIKTDSQVFEKFVKEFIEKEFYILASEFLLLEHEGKALSKKVGEGVIKNQKVSMQKLRDAFSSKENRFVQVVNMKRYAHELLLPFFKEIVSERKPIDEKIFECLC